MEFSALMSEASLRRQITEVGEQAGAEAVAVAYYDYEHRTGWSFNGDRPFHAASTIKVPVLLAVFRAIHEGRFSPNARLHVRNRFLSVADDEPFRVGSERDANSIVHSHIGRTMKLKELAHHMIATSSNLATNLLVDLVGVDYVVETVEKLGIDGIDFHRGVEDERAWQKGINNMVTANGLLGILRRIAELRAFSEESSTQMLDILHAQEFKRGIPAGLPDDARVAHKTGEISTVAHDAGIVFLPEREPYVVVILTGWDADATGRQDAIARISRAVYEEVATEAGSTA